MVISLFFLIMMLRYISATIFKTVTYLFVPFKNVNEIDQESKTN